MQLFTIIYTKTPVASRMLYISNHKRSVLTTSQMSEKFSIYWSIASAVGKTLLLQFKGFDLQVKIDLKEHMYYNAYLKHTNFISFVNSAKTLSYVEFSDFLICLDYYIYIETLEKNSTPVLQQPELSPPPILPSFAPPFLRIPEQQLPITEKHPLPVNQVPLVDETTIKKAFIKLKQLSPRTLLKNSDKYKNILEFFKEYKNGGQIPADFFTSLEEFFNLSETFSEQAHVKQTTDKSWTFPCIFYGILNSKLSINEISVNLMRDILYTFFNKQSDKLKMTLSFIIHAYKYASSINAPTDNPIEIERKKQLVKVITDLIKKYDNNILLSYSIRSDNLKKQLETIGFKTEKHPDGILSSTEDIFKDLRDKERERLLKHLNHFFLNFLLDLSFTAFIISHRYGGMLYKATKNKKEK